MEPLKGKYRLGERLGSGGMGEVYKAEHLLLRKTVAVKLLRDEERENAVAVERFLREARALASVQHPAVCAVFDVDTAEDGRPFIVMEFLEGRTLDTVVKEDAPPVAQRVGWVIEAAKGLQAAHDSGVVHRDVKPSNLMLTTSGVKVLDFGVARMSLVAGERALTGDAAVGTLKFMSPEQLMGEPLDERTDVWSLGVTLFQLLSGQLPFAGDTVGKYVRQVVQAPPLDLADLEVGVSPALARAVAATLQPLDRRTRSMKELVAALEAALIAPVTAAAVDPGTPAGKPTVNMRRADAEPKSTTELELPARTAGADTRPDGVRSVAPLATAQQPTAPPTVEALPAAPRAVLELPAVVPPASAPARGSGGAKWVLLAVFAVPVLVFTPLVLERVLAGPAPERLVNLVVVANPFCSRLVVDGVGRGTTSLMTIPLAPGPHRVSCSLEDASLERNVAKQREVELVNDEVTIQFDMLE